MSDDRTERQKLISAFVTVINNHRGETIAFKELDYLTEDEREFLDYLLDDLKEKTKKQSQIYRHTDDAAVVNRTMRK